MNDMDTSIERCLSECKTIAVVGLSPKAHRDSYRVTKYMQSQGYRIVPVNPNANEVLGERCYATLSEAAQQERIDMVNCFRNAEDIPPIAHEAVAIGVKALWLQLGIAHVEACAHAENAGLTVVQDKCLMVEHAQWLRHIKRRKD
jgi:predicted CoA-binding protein